MKALIGSLLALVLVAAPAAAAKTYTAERFDSKIRILQDGALEVEETVVFRFEGEFTHVFRELPKQRVDGLDIVSAGMDGQTLGFGDQPGQVEVRRRERVRVEWRFAPVSDSSHTFVLTYVVRGVVQRKAGRDVFEWIALPTQHDYRIDSSETAIEIPTTLTARPVVESNRVSEVTLEPGRQRVQVFARGIGKNGWLSTRLEFDEGALIAAAPAWQQRQIAARALAPRWMIAAGTVFFAGLLVWFTLWQRYESPRADAGSSGPVETPPDTLRPGIAGALVTNGGTGLQHAMATLFALADRGVVAITEEPRKWGRRNFVLHRKTLKQTTAPEETAVLNLAFRNKGKEEESVSLTQARNRIMAHLREFKSAVHQELRAVGMLDDERMLVRSRYLSFSIAFLLLAAIVAAPALFLLRQYEGWPLLVAGAVAAVAVIGFICYGALTPLSNEGLRHAARWRAFQKYLKQVTRERLQLTAESPSRLLPFAVALGLAAAWSKYVAHHPTGVPPWFRALAISGDDGGFPAFIAAGGASADGGGAGGASGGAAGGGASGAG